MKNLRPPVAFVLGLWLGALVAATAAWIWFQAWQTTTGSREKVAASDSGQQLRQLRTDNAHLTAENERLHETLDSYREEFEQAPAAPAVAPAATAGKSKSTTGGPADLAKLETSAEQNVAGAVTTLGEASAQDKGETLLRVWNSGKLDFPGQRTAIWYLSNLVETNPKIADVVRALFTNSDTDPELWLSTLDGLSTPSPLSTDYNTRVNLLVELEDTAAPSMRAQIENVRKRLLREWAESENVPRR